MPLPDVVVDVFCVDVLVVDSTGGGGGGVGAELVVVTEVDVLSLVVAELWAFATEVRKAPAKATVRNVELIFIVI